jgi:hypothetical protein
MYLLVQDLECLWYTVFLSVVINNVWASCLEASSCDYMPKLASRINEGTIEFPRRFFCFLENWFFLVVIFFSIYFKILCLIILFYFIAFLFSSFLFCLKSCKLLTKKTSWHGKLLRNKILNYGFWCDDPF